MPAGLTGIGKTFGALQATCHSGALQQHSLVPAAAGTAVTHVPAKRAAAVVFLRPRLWSAHDRRRNAESSGRCCCGSRGRGSDSDTGDGSGSNLLHRRLGCGIKCHRFHKGPRSSAIPADGCGDLSIEVLRQLFGSKVIGVGTVSVSTGKQAPAIAEGTAPQVVSHLPKRIVNEPVADRFRFQRSAARAGRFHSYTSKALVRRPELNCA